MKTVTGYIEDMENDSELSHEELERAVNQHELNKGALSPEYRSAIDQLINEVLRLRFPERVFAVCSHKRALADHYDLVAPSLAEVAPRCTCIPYEYGHNLGNCPKHGMRR